MTLVSSSSSSSSPVLFSARKLSEVDVAVQTADGAGVPAVVVSISSDAVRTNNRTDDAGHVHFYALPPGEYYIRPALKEYIFEPASQVSQSARKGTGVVGAGSSCDLRVVGNSTDGPPRGRRHAARAVPRRACRVQRLWHCDDHRRGTGIQSRRDRDRDQGGRAASGAGAHRRRRQVPRARPPARHRVLDRGAFGERGIRGKERDIRGKERGQETGP